MNKRLWRWYPTGLIISGLVIFLSGCGSIATQPTEVRHLPDDVRVKIDRGNSRQYVRSVLGTPLIGARGLGLEVYRHTGRDIDIILPGIPIPVPAPGQKVIAFVLVAYDEQDLMKEVATQLWIPGHSLDYWITAGGYSFANIYDSEPETLLAPAITYEQFAGLSASEGECALFLLMGECPMEEVSLDNSSISDLSPAGGYCDFDSADVRRHHNYYGAFIRKNIKPGRHRLNIRQKTKHGEFDTFFECAPNEAVYAELVATNTVPDTWYGVRLEGAISISKNPTKNVLDMGMLLPIIWHRGQWYGSPDSPAASSQ